MRARLRVVQRLKQSTVSGRKVGFASGSKGASRVAFGVDHLDNLPRLVKLLLCLLGFASETLRLGLAFPE
ncbi:MAG: hypothetical protein BGP08_15565 [Rhizobiales bacterium 64-17]|nr:MAG: hypothetical protein BGP08_15565 [Rhizobiales bacterium 64-17]